ncbi:acetyl-CoA carboxylase biotin carboxyl carrier protein [Shewanella algae]|uniref:acetyl-CoA carboxylase biotin carboxyl carrier protein n=1 Tax=Shewanella algae TaxID=38313 RepID=UPI001AAF2219|nr:biotin/lipoyl-containing protein [Shewanella algae]MBO2690599.1 acetyl-CoA carboxylase biotin carboxyl carrier protein [Shewanella algae]
MDIRKIKKLIELVQESGINELEITEGQEAVRIRRFSPQQPQASFSIGNDSVQVLAPVAGTFLRSAGDHGVPLVELGTEVEPGTVLGYVQAMKALNPVKAEQSGTVKAILAENGEAVGLQQTLFVLD